MAARFTGDCNKLRSFSQLRLLRDDDADDDDDEDDFVFSDDRTTISLRTMAPNDDKNAIDTKQKIKYKCRTFTIDTHRGHRVVSRGNSGEGFMCRAWALYDHMA